MWNRGRGALLYDQAPELSILCERCKQITLPSVECCQCHTSAFILCDLVRSNHFGERRICMGQEIV